MTDHHSFVSMLRERLAGPLPGRDAQFRMSFAHRVEELQKRLNPPDNARKGSVLVSLWQEEGQWHTALIRRTENPRDRHSGQISFPGGRHDETDSTLLHTALREAQEEVGIQSEKVEILGQLTELYIPISNFSVYPFIGLLQEAPSFQLQAGEVEQVLTPALSHFLDPGIRQSTDVLVGGQIQVRQVPCFMVEGRAVWGATAMIISEFLALFD